MKGYVMKSKWEYCKIEEEKIKSLQEEYKINRLLATVLANREINDVKTETTTQMYRI